MGSGVISSDMIREYPTKNKKALSEQNKLIKELRKENDLDINKKDDEKDVKPIAEEIVSKPKTDEHKTSEPKDHTPKENKPPRKKREAGITEAIINEATPDTFTNSQTAPTDTNDDSDGGIDFFEGLAGMLGNGM